MRALDILLVTPDGKEYNVGEARPYGNVDDRDDHGNVIWDVNWYVNVFEEYVSKALGEQDVAEMKLRFVGVGDRHS